MSTSVGVATPIITALLASFGSKPLSLAILIKYSLLAVSANDSFITLSISAYNVSNSIATGDNVSQITLPSLLSISVLTLSSISCKILLYVTSSNN